MHMHPRRIKRAINRWHHPQESGIFSRKSVLNLSDQEKYARKHEVERSTFQ